MVVEHTVEPVEPVELAAACQVHCAVADIMPSAGGYVQYARLQQPWHAELVLLTLPVLFATQAAPVLWLLATPIHLSTYQTRTPPFRCIPCQCS